MRLLSASWVFPIESPPIEGGALLVSANRILAVGTARELSRKWPQARRQDFPGNALFPALVNAHAHLDLTGLGPAFSGDSFVGWILEVIRRKRGALPRAFGEGVSEGMRRCRRSGQGFVADVLSVGSAGTAYSADGPEVAVYSEILAPSGEGASDAVETARTTLGRVSARRGGFSPHAPYTVSGAAYRATASALGMTDRLMTHVAESEEELAFCLGGMGEIVDRLYGALGLTAPTAPGAHPVDWLDRLGVLGPRTILVHCVHVQAAHIDLVKRRGCGVTLCPRSNRELGVGKAPGRAFLCAGIPVALGTDSLLSSGDLDLWKDAARAVDDYGWSPREALTAATLGGAQVLGVGGERGALVPGLRADVLSLPVRSTRGLWEDVLNRGAEGVQWVDCSSQEGFGSGAKAANG